MDTEDTQEIMHRTADARHELGVNWTRLEGVVGLGALVTSFLWFLGMPAAMAIGVGFGAIFLLDVARYTIFVSSKRSQRGHRGLNSTYD